MKVAQNHSEIMELRKPEIPERLIDRYKTIEKLKTYISAYNASIYNSKKQPLKQQHRDTVEHIYSIYINTYNLGKKGVFKYKTAIKDTKDHTLHCPRFKSNGAALKSRLKQRCINTIGRHFTRLEEADLIWNDVLLPDGNKIRKSGQYSTLVITLRPDIIIFKESKNVLDSLFNKPIIHYLEDIGLEAVGKSKDQKECFYYSPFPGCPKPGDKSKPSLSVNTEKNVWYDHHLKKGGDMAELMKILILNPPVVMIDSS